MLLEEHGHRPIRVACKECIYGHRAPTCTHINKVLVEVRAPGRPRMHCVHGLGHEGKDRCRECFPAIAYVVPGHRGKMGKCACHSNPREPIRDAMRAPQDVAEAHEDDRERAKEMRKLRQSRGSLPQDYDEQRPAKRSYSAADLAVPKETPSCDCGPDLNPSVPFGRHSVYETSESTNCCHPSQDQKLKEDTSSRKKRQKAVPVRPLLSKSGQATEVSGNLDRCQCPSGECTCLGCADHPNNLPTMNLVRELWGHQLSESQQIEMAATEGTADTSYSIPYSSGLAEQPQISQGNIVQMQQALEQPQAPRGQLVQMQPPYGQPQASEEQTLQLQQLYQQAQMLQEQPVHMQRPHEQVQAIQEQPFQLQHPHAQQQQPALEVGVDPKYIEEAHAQIPPQPAPIDPHQGLTERTIESRSVASASRPQTGYSSGSRNSGASISNEPSVIQHAASYGPPLLTQPFRPAGQMPAQVTNVPLTSPSEYGPFEFEYQGYTVHNGCMNENCFCSVGCTCHGCNSHVGHGQFTGAANLLMEGSTGFSSPIDQPSGHLQSSAAMAGPGNVGHSSGHLLSADTTAVAVDQIGAVNQANPSYTYAVPPSVGYNMATTESADTPGYSQTHMASGATAQTSRSGAGTVLQSTPQSGEPSEEIEMPAHVTFESSSQMYPPGSAHQHLNFSHGEAYPHGHNPPWYD